MTSYTLGIDIREVRDHAAGKGRYTEELVKALLQEAPSEMQFLLFCKNKTDRLPENDRVQQVQIPGKSLFWHLRLARYLKKHPVHFFLAPTSFIVPALLSKKQAFSIVVHDLVAFLYKDHHWFPTWIEKLTLGPALRKSRFITVVSEHTQQDLIHFFPKTRQKTFVKVTPAASELFFLEKEEPIEDLPQRYLLTVGTLQPRKNLKKAVEAFLEIASKETDLHLVICGGQGWGNHSFLEKIPEVVKNRIHILGYVSSLQLNTLYRQAEALLFLSLYEGFGLPVLEAMANGCPVIASNRSSLPEVVGEAGLLVDPENLSQIVVAVQEVLIPETAQLLRQKGKERAKFFSWQESARTLLNAIQQEVSR